MIKGLWVEKGRLHILDIVFRRRPRSSGPSCFFSRASWLLLMPFLLTSCGGSIPTADNTTNTKQSASGSLKNRDVSKGLVPNLVGLNAIEATDLLSRANVGAVWDPKSFDQDISATAKLGQVGQNWFVCKQDDAPGTKPTMFGDTYVHVSKSCKGYGVLPNVIGLKTKDAWQVIINHGFMPSYDSSNDLDPTNAELFVCKQDHPVSSTSVNEDIVLTLSKNCNGYGVLPNVVGLNANVAWKLLKDHGFNETNDAYEDLSTTPVAMFVCSQDHPVGSTATDEDIALSLAPDCATSSNNPNSHDGTRIFINEAQGYLNSLNSDVESVISYAQQGYPDSTIYPDGDVSSDLNNLGYLIPPSKYAGRWKAALAKMKAALANFDDALAQWESGIINAQELTPHANQLQAPANDLTQFVGSIPYPK